LCPRPGILLDPAGLCPTAGPPGTLCAPCVFSRSRPRGSHTCRSHPHPRNRRSFTPGARASDREQLGVHCRPISLLLASSFDQRLELGHHRITSPRSGGIDLVTGKEIVPLCGNCGHTAAQLLVSGLGVCCGAWCVGVRASWQEVGGVIRISRQYSGGVVGPRLDGGYDLYRIKPQYVTYTRFARFAVACIDDGGIGESAGWGGCLQRAAPLRGGHSITWQRAPSDLY
jgi:hypothetical protein